MSKKLEVFWIAVLVAIQFRCIAAKRNSSTNGNETDESKDEDIFYPLTVAWIEKPPYSMSPTNESYQRYPQGIIFGIFRHFLSRCGRIKATLVKANSEFEMVQLLKQNKVHIAAPIFEPANNRRYGEFHFFKLHDYAGSEYITTEHKESLVMFDAIMTTWPLVAFTLTLTAIAGVIIWALVGFFFCIKKS